MSNDLIFDVGMHVGDDTDFYLKKGFRVVAVEANPELAAGCRERFAKAIRAGFLIIEEGAISETQGPVDFFVNLQKDDWSSTDPAIAGRNELPVRKITVPSLRLDHLLAEHGVPYYLKIDIEGGDRCAISQLVQFGRRPKYCSVEAHDVTYLTRLQDAGYTQFKVVNQANYWWFTCPDPPLEGRYVNQSFSIHSSGPFGEESAGRWMPLEEAALVYLQIKKIDAEHQKLVHQWCDFHAR